MVSLTCTTCTTLSAPASTSLYCRFIPYSSGISFIPYIFDVVSSGPLLSPPVLARYVLPLSVHGSLPRHSSAEPNLPHVALLREKWGRRVECPSYRSFTDCVLMPLFSTIPSSTHFFLSDRTSNYWYMWVSKICSTVSRYDQSGPSCLHPGINIGTKKRVERPFAECGDTESLGRTWREDDQERESSRTASDMMLCCVQT